MATLKHIKNLTWNLNALAKRNTYGISSSKSFYSYVNEPAMPIPDKEPCWVKTSEEAAERAGLKSGNYLDFLL